MIRRLYLTLLIFAPLCQALPAWWEAPHDKWYFKDDWKGAEVNNYAPTLKLLSPATNGWIVIWGEQGVQLRVNEKIVMKHLDRGLIYDASLTDYIRGATEVKLQAGPGRIVAEGELIDDQGRRYPFASGCDWKTPAEPGTKLTPAAKPYRPGEASGAFHSAHNGLLIRYNDEERGKADISKNLARIQKLRDQSIFLLRRFRSAEDILNFSPDVLWRKAESYAGEKMAEAEKILKEQAIPAQKADNYKEAIALAGKAGDLLSDAERAVNSVRRIEEVKRDILHLLNCQQLLSSVAYEAYKKRVHTVDPQYYHTNLMQITTNLNGLSGRYSWTQGQIFLGYSPSGSNNWDQVEKDFIVAQNGVSAIQTYLSKLWDSPIGKLDEFPEDRFGWFNAQRLLPNDPADWEFSTVNPAANWIDLTGVWSFHTDPPNKGEELGWQKPGGAPADGWKTIHVPREWEREGVLDENEFAPWDCPYKLGDLRCEDKPYNGYAWYRREVLVPKSWSGRKVTLRIEKVSNWLRVFLNGTAIGEPRRDGGLFELPAQSLRPGESNTIAIQVYNHDNFGGIVGAPVSLFIDTQPDLVVTPGPLTWAYETSVGTPKAMERSTALASPMTPAAVFASDQTTVHIWGWEAKGYPMPKNFLFMSRKGTTEVSPSSKPIIISGDALVEGYVVVGSTMLAFEQRPQRIQWMRNELGCLELNIQFQTAGSQISVYKLNSEFLDAKVGPAARRVLHPYLRSVPVACSELVDLDKKNLTGLFFLKYHYLNIPDFTGNTSQPFAPLPQLYAISKESSVKAHNQLWQPETGKVTALLTGGRKFYPISSGSKRIRMNAFPAWPRTNMVVYTAPLIDKSKLLKGVGELFAKRRPELNARGGNTEAQMFDDWKAWGFDHCRYAFAWGADWDIPLQKRMGGPISDDPALWERMDYLVKQHTDRGIMAMLCYFFNEDSPQRDSKNLMRNSTRYWQMHPETRTNCYELWRRIAQRYADYPNGLIAYDFFNEPAYMHRDDWNRIIKDLTQIVRSVDKKHLIVCEAGDGWSQPQWYHWLQPTGDANTIYSFHHYGKHWGYNYDEYYPGYKSTPEKQMDVLLEAILFSLYHNVPIHCGEFGVSMISPGDDHLTWLDDYLAMFERFGIGWNWWNWDGNGIYRTGLKGGDEVSPNLQILRKWIDRKKTW